MRRICAFLLIISALLSLYGCGDGGETGHIHSFVNTEEEQYMRDGATCNSGAIYFSHCECGMRGATFVSKTPGGHIYENIASPDNLVTAADCTHGSIYYSVCSVCGEYGETFESKADKKDHNFIKAPSDKTLATEADCQNSQTHYYICGECGYMHLVTYTIGPKQDHVDSEGDEICDLCSDPLESYPDDPEIEHGTGVHPF